MATIEELETRAAKIAIAEAGAVERLIAEMRDIAVELPDGSKLAMWLAKYAKAMESYPARMEDSVVAIEIGGLWKDLRREYPPDDEEAS